MKWRTPPDWIWRALVFLLALGVLVLITTRWTAWESDAHWQSTDDAYLQADLTPICGQGGRLCAQHCPCRTSSAYAQRPAAGCRSVDDDYRAAVAQADRRVWLAAGGAGGGADGAGASCSSRMCEAARASVAAIHRRQRPSRTRATLTRQQRLLETGSSSTEAGEKAGRPSRAQLAAQLAQNRAPRRTRPRASSAVLEAPSSGAERRRHRRPQQRAALDRSQASISATRAILRRPQDGVIGQRQVKPGQLVGVGGQVTTLTPLTAMSG
jgi:membrane fusion protein, multidrug efflux system